MKDYNKAFFLCYWLICIANITGLIVFNDEIYYNTWLMEIIAISIYNHIIRMIKKSDKN